MNTETHINPVFNSVWDALADTPVATANLRLRTEGEYRYQRRSRRAYGIRASVNI